MGLTYKDSGVDTEAGGGFVKRIAPIVKGTFSPRVLVGIGGFGALVDGSFPDMKEPVLVSGTDGVGTKLAVARIVGRHDTIGIDAVAMCVNDIITCGARPLFFLDYISCGKLNEDVLTDVVRGMAEGCKQAECSLVGGETAEHPGLMPDEDYDIAGFAVGVVDKQNIITGAGIKAGDIVIGIASSGIHSNGYSLVRKALFDIKGCSVDDVLPAIGEPLGNALLAPTRIYVKPVMDLLNERLPVKGIVHITGGGFYENIPRILPAGVSVVINRAAFVTPPIFSVIQNAGGISDKDMFATFNMGIGMMIIADKTAADDIIRSLNASGETAYIIGESTTAERSASVRIV